MAAVIKEGFICAECHTQFTSVETLLAHYQSSHSQEETFIKGLIDKAKSKINLAKKNEEQIKVCPKYNDIYPEVSLGRTNSHFELFKRIRSTQVERLSSEASKLVIRLHKLTSYVGDESKRRNFERNTVQWMDEKLVSRCPDCAASFNVLLSRKHHCRLCGSILCDDCSAFISSEDASKLVAFLEKTPSFPPEYKLRTCIYCHNLVTKLNPSLFSDSSPPICGLYDSLRQLMAESRVLNNEYNSMIESLSRGDNLYSKEQAASRRNELIKLTEKIDGVSKRIVGLEGVEVSESERMLRGRLRMSTIHWIKEFLSHLSNVPSSREKEVRGDGWIPSQGHNEEENEDVIEIQIANLKRWIQEAKKSKRHDEIEMLESNLSDLLQLKNSV